MTKKVELGKVIERFSELEGDLDSVSIQKIVECTDEEHTKASNKVGERLKKIHDPERHGADVASWANNGPFGAEVFEGFGLDLDVFERHIQGFLKRDTAFIQEEIGFGEKPKSAMETLQKSFNILTNLVSKYKEIRGKIPRDHPVWVANALIEQGEEKVNLVRWFGAQYLFKKNAEHEARSLMDRSLQGLKGVMD